MGRREFYAWVNQCHREIERMNDRNARPDSWQGAEQDPYHQRVAAKREREFGIKRR